MDWFTANLTEAAQCPICMSHQSDAKSKLQEVKAAFDTLRKKITSVEDANVRAGKEISAIQKEISVVESSLMRVREEVDQLMSKDIKQSTEAIY